MRARFLSRKLLESGMNGKVTGNAYEDGRHDVEPE